MAARMCSGLFAGIKNSNPVSSRKRTAEKEGHTFLLAKKKNTFLWNRIHKYRTGEIEKEKHTFPWNRIHNTNTHGTKKHKIRISVVKHEQDCIHFFGLDYTNTKTEESQ